MAIGEVNMSSKRYTEEFKIEAIEYATLEWVDWFNNRRLLEPIGDIPPAEYETMYCRQLEELAMVV